MNGSLSIYRKKSSTRRIPLEKLVEWRMMEMENWGPLAITTAVI
jgi:hypothetical protein